MPSKSNTQGLSFQPHPEPEKDLILAGSVHLI